MDELTRFVVTNLAKHQSQKGVRSDIERNPEESIGAALVQLAAELALARSPYTAHVELKQTVARRQRHLVDFGNVPGTYQVTTRVGIILEAIHQILDLVDMSAIGSRPATPLMSINRPQIAVFVSPFVPNSHLVVVQVLDVCITLQKPQQFMDNRAKVKLFRRQARETLGKVVAALASKHGARSRTGTVGAIHPVFHNIFEQV